MPAIRAYCGPVAAAADSNLCYAHIKLMQQKAHIELMLLAFKGHSRPLLL